MNSNISQIIAGLTFIISSLAITIFLVFVISRQDETFELFSYAPILTFTLIFILVGIYLIKSALKSNDHYKYIIKNGIRTTATIIDYEDNNTMYINDRPLLDLIVVFDLHGKKRIGRIATSTTNESLYPIKSNVEVAILANEIVLVK